TGTEVVMVVDRSGVHRAHKLDTTFAHDDGTLRFHFLPAHCGHHLNPIEGFWRVMKDCIGAGRCFAHLPLLYQRTRQLLMAHQERPIYAFHWEHIPPRISRWMLTNRFRLTAQGLQTSTQGAQSAQMTDTPRRLSTVRRQERHCGVLPRLGIPDACRCNCTQMMFSVESTPPRYFQLTSKRTT